MEAINGEWYMKGCGKNDPSRLRTVEDAAELIREIGFLPLFSNTVPGFSMEERTLASDWWTGDPATDPWEWRQTLSRKPDILYGKFFDRKAGFISAEWFPAFANYRRNGYDFDTLCDEGLAPHRAKKLMAPFLTDGMPNETALLSCVLKEQTGFGKGGEKNFEGILTELQMQTFLIIADFRQRMNKRGESYGWHIALIESPEAKLGYDRVTSAYHEQPLTSKDQIVRHLCTFFPAVSGVEFEKVIGKAKN